jgi:hypothetical protein
VAAGEKFGVGILGKQRGGFIDAGGAVIGGLVHDEAPSWDEFDFVTFQPSLRA